MMCHRPREAVLRRVTPLRALGVRITYELLCRQAMGVLRS
jgi:hypothetical protein